MNKILIKNADILTVNNKKENLKSTDILIEGNKISQIARNINDCNAKVIDASGKVVLPGFVQTHIHLCQTLFRGMAEGKFLLNWLKDHIWPYEAAHDAQSTYYSAMLGISEMISSGTTTILDMGGVNHGDEIFRAIKNSGIRALAGKAMMDSGEGVPENILETTDSSIKESMELYQKWNGAENGRIKYAFAPRFILSCSDDLFREIGIIANQYKIPVHTHAYEQQAEGEAVVALKGMREFEYFEKMNLLNERFLAAHCIWTDEKDIELMKKYKIKPMHCPSSNFKLGSGMLDLKRLIDNEITVSIGADGAPCNNNLDMLQEIRTTALMQNVISTPDAINAYKYIELATIEGAKALGLDSEIGSIETGKKADLQIIDLDDIYNFSAKSVDIATKIVYSSNRNNVKTVIVDGQIVMQDKTMTTVDTSEILNGCTESLERIFNHKIFALT